MPPVVVVVFMFVLTMATVGSGRAGGLDGLTYIVGDVPEQVVRQAEEAVREDRPASEWGLSSGELGVAFVTAVVTQMTAPFVEGQPPDLPDKARSRAPKRTCFFKDHSRKPVGFIQDGVVYVLNYRMSEVQEALRQGETVTCGRATYTPAAAGTSSPGVPSTTPAAPAPPQSSSQVTTCLWNGKVVGFLRDGRVQIGSTMPDIQAALQRGEAVTCGGKPYAPDSHGDFPTGTNLSSDPNVCTYVDERTGKQRSATRGSLRAMDKCGMSPGPHPMGGGTPQTRGSK